MGLNYTDSHICVLFSVNTVVPALSVVSHPRMQATEMENAIFTFPTADS